jgi:hypothetical protein
MGFWTREIDLQGVRDWLRSRWVWLVVAVGMALRLCEYVRDRPYWLDEMSLAANLIGQRVLEGPKRLVGEQLAPFGFLVVERGLANWLGGTPLVLRLFPQVCGLASLPLFAIWSRRWLRPSALPVALGLFAVSDPLIYFSAELKPYGVDVLAVLVCALLPTGVGFSRTTAGQRVGLAILGAALVWFSFPVAFSLAAVGLPWLSAALVDRRWREGWSILAIVGTWLLSFLGSYLAARGMLTTAGGMWAFWDFAFVPRSFEAGPIWIARRLLNLFANPLHFDTPLGPRFSAILGAGLWILGAVSLGRRHPEPFARVVLPVGLALGASLARVYPFHGRLLLFLLPGLYLLIAEGVATLGETRIGRHRECWLAAFLLIWPVLQALGHLFEPASRTFSPFGDLRPNPFL